MTSSKPIEEQEEDVEVEFTTSSEYLHGACYALTTMSEIDTALLTKQDEIRVKRIRRICLKVIDKIVCEYNVELFENPEED